MNYFNKISAKNENCDLIRLNAIYMHLKVCCKTYKIRI